jgi:LDH2 family malate/lactate/ureidoglycolate dehydrogenase
MSLRTDPGVRKFDAANLQGFGRSLLMASGLAEDRAHDVAEVLLEGDLLGHTTHGFALLPAYLKAIQEKTMETVGEPDVIADHGSSLTWDGRYLPGPWLIRRAIAVARTRITEQPVITISIRRSHHIGCLQAYLQPVTEAGLVVLLSCSDPASRTVTPHGGVAPRFSPNPLAAGIPTNGDPILIDISTSSTSNGRCNRVAADGERLPGPWLVDRDGRATDDPCVLDGQQGGAILPLGGMDLGYKGFALALLVEVLTNALAGHGRADDEPRWGASCSCRFWIPSVLAGENLFCARRGSLPSSARKLLCPQGNRPFVCQGRLHSCVGRNN